jgi:hypothetical protein
MDRFLGRSRLTAASARESDSLIVTHPFHPLAGQRVPILFERRSRSTGQRVYVCDGGILGTLNLREGFTDRAEPPGIRPLTVDILADLSAVVSTLQKSLTGRGEERKKSCI